MTVTHNGLYGGQDSYAVRGHREFCPCCEDSHGSNGAFLTHLGGLFFRYKCMNPHASRTVEVDLREFHRNRAPEPEESRYLPPFTHIKAKIISISAGMGTGKTYQIEREIAEKDPQRVLIITCRRGMAATLTGRFSGFTNYQDSINEDRQIIEYESLHRLSWMKYSMIIIDEIRSTLSSAVCSETNNGHMQENMEKLQHLIYEADRVICADADLHIDGAVQCFCDTVFKNEEIHHIDHKGGGQELHVRFADSAAFVKTILKDLRAGKRIGVCCGSALELKTIKKLALDVVGEDELGIYYANSPQQAEIADVSTHWPKYKLIGFTSTITVSVDYTGPIDKVYISPSRAGCGPRDMNQMKSRFRDITSGIVVVKIPKPMTAPLEPLNANMAALHAEEMNRIMNRRTYITGVMTENQRQLNQTIFKQGVGHEAKFYPTLLTKLAAWSHAERFLADFHWIQMVEVPSLQKNHLKLFQVIQQACRGDLPRKAVGLSLKHSGRNTSQTTEVKLLACYLRGGTVKCTYVAVVPPRLRVVLLGDGTWSTDASTAGIANFKIRSTATLPTLQDQRGKHFAAMTGL